MAKRIVLYLARAAPQQTIDHLVAEASRQIAEEPDTPPPSSEKVSVSVQGHLVLL